MAIRVMLVDDSAVVRGLMARALTAQPGIEIIATAIHGAAAIPMAAQYLPDIILLDIEMPEMDGLTALPKLLEASPKTKIIMVSTLTLRNAAVSLKALELGAADYVAKPTARAPEELELFYRELREKIQALAGAAKSTAMPAASSAPAAQTPIKLAMHAPAPAVKALAIASSTGGPQALLKLFGGLKGKLAHLPIFITQHMPATFTTILAENITQAAGRLCMEGKDGEKVKPGQAYLAPGDYHMTAVQDGADVILRLDKNPPVNFCRPAADPMFKSLSALYGRHLLAAVLTGMGQDGLEGAKTIAAAGGTVIAQDEATSVVWGMPRAVAGANICHAVLPLPDIAGYLIKQSGG